MAFPGLLQDRRALENTQDYPALAHRLYQSLIEEVLPQLPERVLIVPDSWLSALPFEALYTLPGSMDWTGAPFLLHKADFYYAFSLGVLE